MKRLLMSIALAATAIAFASVEIADAKKRGGARGAYLTSRSYQEHSSNGPWSAWFSEEECSVHTGTGHSLIPHWAQTKTELSVRLLDFGDDGIYSVLAVTSNAMADAPPYLGVSLLAPGSPHGTFIEGQEGVFKLHPDDDEDLEFPHLIAWNEQSDTVIDAMLSGESEAIDFRIQNNAGEILDGGEISLTGFAENWDWCMEKFPSN